MSQIYGKHYLVELLDCNASLLKYVDDVQRIFMEAVKVSQATVVDSFFKQYDPEGVTGVVLISESHFAIHTWPEDGFVAFDIFTCGSMDSQASIDYLKDSFQAKNFNVRVLSRGRDI